MRTVHVFLAAAIAALLSFGVGAPASTGASAAGLHEPSNDASNMPGALGTINFKPKGWKGPGSRTWWIDTDGLDPGTAGCHIEVNADGKTFKGSRVFAEKCVDKVVLIESNPGKNVLHAHGDDTGHPDTFDCAAWCRVAKGARTGVCRTVPAPDACGRAGLTSAKCVCH